MITTGHPDREVNRMKNKIYVRGASRGTLEQKNQDAITAEQLVGIQRQVKIGDIIMVRTQKGNHKACGNGKTGVWREGTVIGIFRNFAHVRLQSGVCESVSWLEIAGRDREDDDEED